MLIIKRIKVVLWMLGLGGGLILIACLLNEVFKETDIIEAVGGLGVILVVFALLVSGAPNRLIILTDKPLKQSRKIKSLDKNNQSEAFYVDNYMFLGSQKPTLEKLRAFLQKRNLQYLEIDKDKLNSKFYVTIIVNDTQSAMEIFRNVYINQDLSSMINVELGTIKKIFPKSIEVSNDKIDDVFSSKADLPKTTYAPSYSRRTIKTYLIRSWV